MRIRLLDLRDAYSDEDVLIACGVDLRLPNWYDYTWESLEKCLRDWSDTMKIRVIADSTDIEDSLAHLAAIIINIDTIAIEMVELTADAALAAGEVVHDDPLEHLVLDPAPVEHS